MKKLITLLVGVLVTFTSHAAAQGPVEVIVYDACYPYYWGQDNWEWAMTCDSYLMTADGSKGALVGTGVVDPAVSPDGGRIAFGGDGIFVLNLSDWSYATVSNFGDSPAWSPDGTKLAFAAGTLYVMGADGSSVTPVPNVMGSVGLPAWSPNGLAIAFDCQIESGNLDICSINIDGTGFMRLTSDPAWESGAAYSPDGLTVAFATNWGGGPALTVMNPDGTNVRFLGNAIAGAQPAWSPDGTRIAFGVSYSPQGVACNADGSICWEALETNDVMVVNADGSGLGGLVSGRNPAWALAVRPVASFLVPGCDGVTCSFDGSASWGGNGTISYSWDFGDGTTDSGSTAAHSYAAPGTYTVTLTAEDGTGVTGTQKRTVVISDNLPPTAAFTYECTGRQCTFNGGGSSDPNGPIATYFWSFGDGETASSATGPTITHTYASSGAFAVTLIVIDDAGSTGTQQHVVSIVNINAPPTASFTRVCTELTCSFDGSSSSDTDGTIAGYAWSFGDNTGGSGATVNHTYAAGGTYAVVLTVTDTGAATSSQTQSVTVVPPEMHVGDLDGRSTSTQSTWTASVTVMVHSSGHGGVPNAAVSGSWNDGSSAECMTTASGECAVSRTNIPKNTHSVRFSITSVTRSPFVNTPAANHDPDADSNGVSITVRRP